MMKVYDVLTEAKKVDEGPVRFLKRTLGKNTAAGQAAQLDVQLDKEVSKLYKEFYAVAKQDPQLKGMTAKGLANYIVGKGFAGKPSEVMRFINQDPSLGRQLAKGAKKVAKGAKVAGKGIAKGAGAVARGAKKVGGAIKKRMSAEPSTLTPQNKQMELPLAQSMYGESINLNEVDMPLSGAQVKKVLKGFVRKGFKGQLGGRLAKSDYGDADQVAQQQSAAKNKKVGISQANIDLSKQITQLQKAGYKVIAPKKQTA